MNCRRLIFVALLAGIRALSAAEDEKKPADDTIATARRELEALKADQIGGMSQPKAGLPAEIGISALPVPSQEGASAFAQKMQEQLKAKTKSSSWLIDAMGKNARSSRDFSRNVEPGDMLKTSRSRPETFDASKARLESRSQQALHEQERSESSEMKTGRKAGPNPLAGFMASWMTPRDYALLQKSPSSDVTARSFSLPAATEAMSADPAGILTRFEQSPLTPPATGLSGTTSSPHENPYLASGANPLLAPAPGGKETNLPPPTNAGSAPASARSLVPDQAPPIAPPAPFVPEKLQRPDDAKYFPQLKRF